MQNFDSDRRKQNKANQSFQAISVRAKIYNEIHLRLL